MPPKRKAATTTSKASTKSTAKMGAKVTTPAPAGQSTNTARRSARNNQSNASVTYSPPPQAVESSPKRVKTTRARTERKTDSREVFSPMRCAAWFEEYKDPEDHLQRIGPEGFERWLNDLGLQIDSPYMILLSWKLNAATMGYFTKDEWMGGFAKWEVDSNDILKTKIGSLYECLNSPESFKELYKYTFSFSKEGNQKCVQVEIAIEMWRQLFDNKYPHVKLFLEFLTEKQPVKVINKDQWNSLLEFVSTISENFEDYDENSAWPVLFDEYVEWRKAKMEE